MQHHRPVVLEQRRAFLEELVVEAGADMLEHADRDNAVERLRDVAIVDQLELRLVGEAGFGGALVGDAVLLLGEGDAGHGDIRHFREIETEATPAAADIQDLLSGGEAQLGREVTLLGELRVVERLAGVFEVGAAVLPVGIEE